MTGTQKGNNLHNEWLSTSCMSLRKCRRGKRGKQIENSVFMKYCNKREDRRRKSDVDLNGVRGWNSKLDSSKEEKITKVSTMKWSRKYIEGVNKNKNNHTRSKWTFTTYAETDAPQQPLSETFLRKKCEAWLTYKQIHWERACWLGEGFLLKRLRLVEQKKNGFHSKHATIPLTKKKNSALLWHENSLNGVRFWGNRRIQNPKEKLILKLITYLPFQFRQCSNVIVKEGRNLTVIWI